MIFDESHYLKNAKAKRTKAALKLSKLAKHVLCLTGTPVLNRPVELYSQIKIINPNLFPNFFQYAKRYCNVHETDFGWDFTGASNLTELQEILRTNCMIRRLKKDVLSELPPKRRAVISVELSNENEYRQAEEDFLEYLRDIDPEAADRAALAEALVKVTALRKLAGIGKIEAVRDWISDFLESGEKLVVFCHHREVLSTLAEEFSECCVSAAGSDPPQKRTETVNRFQNDPYCRLFIGSILAAGVGLTLTAASNVLIAELPWRPADLTQAEDRLHRISQTYPVTSWIAVASDTIEEKIFRILAEKEGIARNALDDGADGDGGLREMLVELKSVV